MPTYEYKCDACEETFEKFQSIMAAPIKKCPACGKSKVKRLIGTGAGLIFKGSGFYITDYRDSNYKDSAKKDSSAPAAEGKSEGGKEAAKPAEAKPAVESKPAEKAAPAEPKPAAKSSSAKGKKK